MSGSNHFLSWKEWKHYRVFSKSQEYHAQTRKYWHIDKGFINADSNKNLSFTVLIFVP